jgi:hypothetical protein
VIAVADAEDGEFCRIDGFAGAPVEGEGSALGVDVSWSPVGEKLVIAALQVRALCAAGKNFYVFEEVRDRVTPGGVVGVEAVVAGEVEEEAGLLCGFGRGQHCAGEQAKGEE